MTTIGTAVGADRPRGVTTPATPLPWLLRRVNQRYRADIGHSLAERGFGQLPQPGYWALSVLARGGTEASDLTREMGVSKQAVSKLVDLLVSSGFVVREPHATDRRRTMLGLSARGRAAAAVIEEASRGTEAAMVEALGEDRFASLVQMLTKVAGPSSR